MGRKSKKRALQGVQGAVSRAAKRRTAGDNVPKSSAFVTRCLERGLTFEDPEDNEAGDMPSNLIWIKEELSSEDVSNESFMEHPRLIQDFDVKAEIDEEFDEIENKLEIKEEPVEYHDSEYSIRFEESVGRVEDSKDFINVSNLCQLENGERASQRIRGCNLASDDSDSNRDFEKDDDGFASDEENQDDEFTPCTSTTKMKSLTDPTRQVKMGPMQMTDVEKARIPALREEKVPIKEIVRRTGKGNQKDGKSSVQKRVRIPSAEVRTRGACHMPQVLQRYAGRQRCRYPGCTQRTRFSCKTCKVFLCISADRECYSLFHKL
ncbi:uncharacterized protein LOC119589928 isoform X2 [Penaeus monodon]|uniref:uncharacterized protein LOC119589928 isoform X2 n=1 Tax=Penaeus monodon TaxID=6687 RepID=UPI0018A723AE|nr:uncharacterized protein LOC119589928 isoform X2 [Penaeus monodon]